MRGLAKVIVTLFSRHILLIAMNFGMHGYLGIIAGYICRRAGSVAFVNVKNVGGSLVGIIWNLDVKRSVKDLSIKNSSFMEA